MTLCGMFLLIENKQRCSGVRDQARRLFLMAGTRESARDAMYVVACSRAADAVQRHRIQQRCTLWRRITHVPWKDDIEDNGARECMQMCVLF